VKIDFNRKYTTIAAYAVITFAICLAMVLISLNFKLITEFAGRLVRILAPVIWGIVFAYMMNPVMVFAERHIKPLLYKKKPRPKLTRALSVAVSMIFFIILVAAILSIVMPQVIDSLLGIFNNSVEYFTSLELWIYELLEKNPDAIRMAERYLGGIEPRFMQFVENMMPSILDMSVKVRDGALYFIGALMNAAVGFILAAYLLLGKETFIAQGKKTVHAIFPKSVSGALLKVGSNTNERVGGFILGKLLDSLIVGIICFIWMNLINWEFPALISVIIGVTNIIPFFGPFIGAVPSALLLLVVAPNQVIPFVIFIFILQQFDGNILGPAILGDSTGLPPFWVIVAIFIGGGLFGFPGMLLGVPVFAVLYGLANDLLHFLLKRKNMSPITSDYIVPNTKKKKDN